MQAHAEFLIRDWFLCNADPEKGERVASVRKVASELQLTDAFVAWYFNRLECDGLLAQIGDQPFYVWVR